VNPLEEVYLYPKKKEMLAMKGFLSGLLRSSEIDRQNLKGKQLDSANFGHSDIQKIPARAGISLRRM